MTIPNCPEYIPILVFCPAIPWVRRSLLMRAVHFRWNVKAVPVNQLGKAGVIRDVDCHGFAFVDPQQRTRYLAVVGQRLYRMAMSQIGCDFANAQRDIGGWLVRRSSNFSGWQTGGG
jgi:hypothetical protein